MEGACAQPRLIETMHLAQQGIALWSGHRARLLHSARALDYPLATLRLDSWLDGQLQAIRSRPCRLRLLLAADGRLTLESSELSEAPYPARIALADTRLDAEEFWLQHKSTHRPWFRAAQHWLACHPDYFDLIFANAAGDVCEGSRCNIHIQDEQGQWLTPARSCGLLPGVQRQALLDRGCVREARIRLADVYEARALRVSNALRGWLDAELVTRTPPAPESDPEP